MSALNPSRPWNVALSGALPPCCPDQRAGAWLLILSGCLMTKRPSPPSRDSTLSIRVSCKPTARSTMHAHESDALVCLAPERITANARGSALAWARQWVHSPKCDNIRCLQWKGLPTRIPRVAEYSRSTLAVPLALRASSATQHVQIRRIVDNCKRTRATFTKTLATTARRASARLPEVSYGTHIS